MTHWTTADIPAQDGRRAVVTGANSGLGLLVSEHLARAGARVTMTSRDLLRGEAAADAVRRMVPGADVEVARLDLADLASVRRFAAGQRGRRIDLLVNNAGVMAVPTRQLTADGFERHLGTNHLGHFALTLLLLPELRDVPGARVLTVSSDSHETRGAAELDVSDLGLANGYAPMKAYAQSKMANALFTVELERRLRATSAQAISVAANPGYTATNLQRTGPRSEGLTWQARALGAVTRAVAAPPSRGVLPLLHAATAPDVQGGSYTTLSGPRQMFGHPVQRPFAPLAQDADVAVALWDASERLTGVRWGAQALAAHQG